MARKKRKTKRKKKRKTTKKRRMNSSKFTKIRNASYGPEELLLNMREEFDFEDIDTKNITKSLKDYLEEKGIN